jgi:bla regulator protein blaR1
MTGMMTQFLQAIVTTPALMVVVKATLVLVVAMLAVRLATRARAALRHSLLAAAFAAILALPVLTVLLPAVQLPIPKADAGAFSPAKAVEQPMRSGRKQAVAASGDVAINPPVSVATLLLSVWALGACLVFAPVAVGLFRLRHLRRTGLPALDMFPAVNELLADAGLRRQVDVVLHEDIHVPMMCGTVRPTILLPMDAHRWTAAERQNVFVHELEHIRRSDWLVHLVARATCSVYWFQPLTWAAWRQLTLDAERACDDVVVQQTDGAVYAHHLVTLAQRLSAKAAMPALSMARRSDLTARVSAILNQDQVRGRVGFTPKRVIVSAAIVIALGVSALTAVQVAPPSPFAPAVAGARPAFDVASIKESTRDASEGCGRFPYPTRVEFINCTIESTIVIIYRMQRGQLMGAPDWLESKRFDIIATSETPFTGQEGLGLMRQLLADRFNLKMRVDTEPKPVYVLKFARSDKRLGPNLRANAICTATAAAVARGETPPKPSPCQPQLKRAPGSFVVRGNQFGTFARNEFPYLVDRPIVDETGLTDFFDFDLTFAPIAPGGSPDSRTTDDRPSIFTAVEEQLGLKLVPETRPVSVMVIDSVSQPPAN